jgi:3-dehydroquinate dehydratase
MYDARVRDLSLVQGPFSVAPCQTLTVRFATCASLYALCMLELMRTPYPHITRAALHWLSRPTQPCECAPLQVSYEVVACQSRNAGVLVLSEFAGAAQSLGAGAILVNPWNVSDLAAAIKEALQMPEAERRELHRQNFMHVTVHTSHAWADTFISELNDTHVEAALRTMHTPPQARGKLTTASRRRGFAAGIGAGIRHGADS